MTILNYLEEAGLCFFALLLREVFSPDISMLIVQRF